MSQNTTPLVSVLCLTYNHELYIEDAIKGFLLQKTDFPFEVIIHDDASSDGTAAIVKRYQQQYPDLIKPIFQKENQFSKEKRKVTKIVFSAAKGKYFAYCEGDDYWTDPLKLQKQVDFLENHPEFAVIHTAFEERFEKNSGIRRSLQRTLKPKSGYVFFDLLHANFVGTLTAMVRADIIKNLEGIYEKNYIYDYWLWLRIAENHKLKYFNQATAVYRIHGQSLTAKKVFLNVRIFHVMKDAIFSYLKNNPYGKLKAKEKDIIIWAIFRIIKSKEMSFQDKRSSLKFILNHPGRISRLFKIGLSKFFSENN